MDHYDLQIKGHVTNEHSQLKTQTTPGIAVARSSLLCGTN